MCVWAWTRGGGAPGPFLKMGGRRQTWDPPDRAARQGLVASAQGSQL